MIKHLISNDGGVHYYWHVPKDATWTSDTGQWIATAHLNKFYSQLVKRPMWKVAYCIRQHHYHFEWISFASLRRLEAQILKDYPGEDITK